MNQCTCSGIPRVSDFNEDWRFLRGASSGAQSPSFDDGDWRTVRLPHDFGVEGAFTRLARSTVGFLRTGEGWYRKTFDAPESWRGRRVSLSFDGAMELTEIWLNGVRLAEHHNGYAPFHVDLTAALRYGEPNVLAVHTNTPEPCSRWYPGAGLYRDVTLVVTDPVHVSPWGVRIAMPTLAQDVADGHALVQVETWLGNGGDADAEARVRVEILDADGAVIASEQTEDAVTLPAGALADDRAAAGVDATVTQQLDVPGPHLWSVEDPYRYALRTSVIVDGSVVDETTTPFGLRWLDMSSETGLSLNGVRIKIAGMCMHHDLGSLGAAVNRRAVVRQLEILKEAGVNAIRTAHNIGSKVQIEEASRMGFLVLEELADMWTAPKDRNDYSNYFLADSATDLKAMIGRDRNEPSVFMWSLGNEVAWQESELPLADRLVAVAHAADPARPVCVNDSSYLSKGIDGIGNEIHERMDVRGYSYAAEQYLRDVHAKHPNDPIINSESGCSLGSRGWYAYPTDVPDGVRGSEFPFAPGRQPWDDDTYEITSYDATANRGTPIRKDFMRSMTLDFHMGEFTWTGFDYIGEPAPYIGNFYWNDPSQTESDGTVLAPKTAYYGIVDSAGFPKDEWHLYRSLWRDPDDAPMVHLLPHWNWRQGELVQVWAYANAASVELFLNGRSLGVREFDAHRTGFHLDPSHADKPFEYRFAKDDPREPLYLSWDVRFRPGTLVAVARDGEGREVARDVVTTAGSPTGIRLTPDRHVIDGTVAGVGSDLDVSFVTADIVDAAGTLCPDADAQLTFEAEHGVILGTDNGYQASTEPFQKPVRKAYRGKALVIVAPDGSGQPIRLHARAAGLADAETTIFLAGDVEADDQLEARPAFVRVRVGETPALPESVTVALGGNRTATVPVTWAPVEESAYAAAGSFVVDGVAGDGLAVRALVTVVQPIGTMPVAGVARAGEKIELPGSVTVVYDDGSLRDAPVVWQAVDAAAASEADKPIEVRGALLTGDRAVDALHATAGVRVLRDGEDASLDTALADLTVNGATIDGFDPSRKRYALTLPYDAAAPVIAAVPRHHASVAVVPPSRGIAGAYLVEIAAEDGTRGGTVTIDVTVPPAPIASLSLAAPRTALVEDETCELRIDAVDVLGQPIDPARLDLELTRSSTAVIAVDPDASGVAMVRATLAGEATVVATASYAGGSAASAPLRFTVGKAQYAKQPTGVDPVAVRCKAGERPDLPATATVRFSRGFDAQAPVTWEAGDALWREPGTHAVHGEVEGLDVAATANVTVVDVAAVQRVSTATVTGIAPDLAETAPTVRVWWTDGQVDDHAVTWHDAPAGSFDRPGIVTVRGDVDGVDAPAEATVRVTDEHARNRDLFSFRNDVYPTVDASYANTDPKVMEDVSNLMDGTVSYTARAGYNLKNRWSTLGDPSSEAWLEYRFGYGTETAFMLNAFTVYYCLEGEGVALPSSVRVKAWDGSRWVAVRDLAESDKPVEQQNAAGWIYGSFGDKTRDDHVDRGLERTYSFAMVKTSRMRIEFTSEPGSCVAITEIRGDAQIAVANETCALRGLLVNGAPATLSADGTAFTAPAPAAGSVRIEPVPAGDNAAITVIPAAGGSDATVEVTAENGLAKRSYAVRLR